MCLICDKKPVVKRTGKDRVFYKILAVVKPSLGGGYKTPYARGYVDLDKLIVEDETDDFHAYFYHVKYEVTFGGFHLFTNKRNAFTERNWLEKHYLPWDIETYKVFKAVVPEGTPYIEGYCEFNKKSVVVKKVRYEEL